LQGVKKFAGIFLKKGMVINMSSKSKWVNQLSKKKSKLLMEKPSFMVKFPKLSHPDNEKELPKVIDKLEDISNMDDYDKRHHKLMLDIVGEDIKDWEQFIKDTDIHVIRLKMKYGRPRPYELSDKIDSKTDTDDTPSFPSGHATEAYALEKVLGQKYPDKKKELKEMADKIAMSRVQMGNHFPSDIKAGKKVGYLIADEYLQVSKSWKYILKNRRIDVRRGRRNRPQRSNNPYGQNRFTTFEELRNNPAFHSAPEKRAKEFILETVEQLPYARVEGNKVILEPDWTNSIFYFNLSDIHNEGICVYKEIEGDYTEKLCLQKGLNPNKAVNADFYVTLMMLIADEYQFLELWDE